MNELMKDPVIHGAVVIAVLAFLGMAAAGFTTIGAILKRIEAQQNAKAEQDAEKGKARDEKREEMHKDIKELKNGNHVE